MTLEEGHKVFRREIERGRSSTTVLPGVELPLIQKPVFRRRDELLRSAAISAEIGVVGTGHCHERRVVEIVVPERVDAMLDDEAEILGLVLADDDDRSAAGGG